MAPALEIIERRGDFAGDLNLALADNAQQKAFVTGAAIPPPRGVRSRRGERGHRRERGALGAGDGHRGAGTPAASIAWLANKLAEFGLPLEAGMQVMSGSFTRQYVLKAGDRVEARFTPVGNVTAEFV